MLYKLLFGLGIFSADGSHRLVEFCTVKEIRRCSKPKRIVSHFCGYLHYSSSNCYLDFLNLIEHQKSKFLVETIQHHDFLECCPFFENMGSLWSLKQRVHIGGQAIITDIIQIILGFPLVFYIQAS